EVQVVQPVIPVHIGHVVELLDALDVPGVVDRLFPRNRGVELVVLLDLRGRDDVRTLTLRTVVAPPHPDEAVPLLGRVRTDLQRAGYAGAPAHGRGQRARALGVEQEAVVRAFDRVAL